jgi:hypothetical protein
MQDVVKSQYHASLDMLSQAIMRCPDALWDERSYKNPFWNVGYHALFYTHLYLQPTQKDFVAWSKHRAGYHNPDQGSAGEPYGREEILEYLQLCREQVEKQVPSLEMDAPSGFSWLPFSKLELQFYSVRHLQQHIGELCERLGTTGGVEVDWVATKAAA